MGDVRFLAPYRRIKNARDPLDEIRQLSDEEVIAALSAAGSEGDPYVSNVLTTEAQNRITQYSAIVRTMGDGVFAVGPLGRLAAMNPAAERVLGWTFQEARGMDVDELLSCTVQGQDGRWHAMAVCGEALQATAPIHQEDALFTRRDGTRLSVAFTAAPILREDDVRGAVVVFRDITARRRTEDQLRRLAAIVQASDDGIFSRDLEGIITSWNPACEALFGYTSDEAIGRHVSVLYAPHRAQEDRALLSRVERGETVRHYETQRVTKDGRLVDVSVSISPLRAPDGRILGYSSVNRDIRERVRAERALRETRHLLDAIVQGTTDIIYAKDRAGKYLLVNHAGARLLGVGQDQLVGMSDADFFPVDEVARMRADEQAIMTDGAPRTIEEHLTIARRRHVYLTTKSPLRDADGTVTGIVAIAHDITERRRTEDDARRLAAIVEASDDAILSLGLDGTILTWNPRAAELYGYTAAEAIGRHASLVVPQEMRADFEALLSRVSAGGELHHHMTKRLQRGGTLLDISLTATPIRDKHGKVVALSWIAQDVTEAKRREEALRRSEERHQLLLDSVTDHAIFQLDPRGYVLTWNPAAERIKGWKADEIIGWHYSILFPPEEVIAGDPWKELDDARKKGRHDGEERRIRKDGKLFDASITLSAMRDASGELVGFVKVTRDVSERKTWTRRLETAEARHARLLDLHPGAVAWCDPDGGIAAVNDAFARHFGSGKDELAGRTISSLVVPDERDAFVALLEALQDGAPRETHVTVTTKEGGHPRLACRLTPIVVDTGTTGFFALFEPSSGDVARSKR